jgi:hypothetical protein
LEGNILDVEAGKREKDDVAHGGEHDVTLIGHRDCVSGAIGGTINILIFISKIQKRFLQQEYDLIECWQTFLFVQI